MGTRVHRSASYEPLATLLPWTNGNDLI